ncbi:phytanoyl-CoA dioxygenase family protein [Flavimaricola marinus]|uniref:Phytanoyl-CoA dioxygenase (PhyH) n=1 Tax=Flavimaricola marinus TaxID=1819565 RepID=A0A238LGZ4_9RHOB|nr:phytanoyl-CoA dioxygenase family protein [Flavimaricola marinus]SMY08898.1 Phytanoyl-CoA dioxygenase (PhyH) [Flavimaricola marinus]
MSESKLDLEVAATEFARDGYVAIHPLFDTAKMVEINAELDRYIADIMPKMPVEEVYFEDRSDRKTLKQMQKLSVYDEYFRDLTENGVIRDLASAVMGEQAVPQNLQYFNKPAGIGQPTPPHQDGYYFHLKPCKAVTGWLALEPVDEENGCIHYVRGSHKAAEFRPHGRSNVLGFSQGLTDFGTNDDAVNTVSFPGGEGTFLMHDAHTIHWAGPNRSPTRSRRALGFVYFGESAKIDEASKAAYKAKLEADLRAQKKI